MRAVLPWLFVGCGRLGFDPVVASGDGDGAPGPVAASNLIAWYPMDGLGTGNQLLDISGHGHHGICAMPDGCPSLIADGNFAGAFEYDGIDDLFRVASTPLFITSGGYTISAWIELEVDIMQRQCFVNKRLGVLEKNSWSVCVESDRSVSFFADRPTMNNGLTSPKTLDLGSWFHIACRWDGTTQQILIDNVMFAEQPFSGIGFDDGEIEIGADVEGGGLIVPLRGRLDDVRVYNRMLDDVEIAQIGAGG